MNKYIAVCYDEMAEISKEIMRINKIIEARSSTGDHENEHDARKWVSLLNMKKQVIFDLVSKMEQVT